MGYHTIDPATLDQWDDRPVDVRSISTAAGLDYQDSPLGMRIYDAKPGEQLPKRYHYHDEQVEAFYVIDGPVRIETPDGTFDVSTDQVFVVEPGHAHRAYNPEDATANARVLAIGAPTADDAHTYHPDEDA